VSTFTRKRLLGLAAAGAAAGAVPAALLSNADASQPLAAAKRYRSKTAPAASINAPAGWFVRDAIAPGMTAPQSVLLLSNERIPFAPWGLDWDTAILETLSASGAAIGVVAQDRTIPPRGWLSHNAVAELAGAGVDVDHEPMSGRKIATGAKLAELTVLYDGYDGLEKRVGWFHTDRWDIGIYTWIAARGPVKIIEAALASAGVN
jgi:hypothetical protein